MKETGKKYWRSLDQLRDTPQFREWLHREFPENASEMLDGTSRRTLLKLMAASFGLAGLTACSRPAETILPASRGVENYVPGKPSYYATAMSLGGTAAGLLVETHEGRPTKIEGNPDHPASAGAASAFSQASVLSLYDPDRSGSVLHAGRKADWREFESFARQHFDRVRAKGGEGLRFLSRSVNSPSFDAVRTHTLKQFPRAKWVEYEPVSRDAEMAGARLAFGRPLQAHYHFDKADAVLSLDSDFLGLDSPAVSAIRDFSRRRRVSSPKDTMSRLYAAESQFSVTGAMADHRLRVRASEIAAITAELLRQLKLAPPALTVLDNGDGKRKWIAAVARDLAAHRGRCVVIAGPRQPAEVHAAAHLINHALGNQGATVTYTPSDYTPQLNALAELAGEMAAGKVETLVVFGGNPAYDAPADLQFQANLNKVPATVHVGLEQDETAFASKWHVPEAHYLESWGDARALDGTVTIQQPMIAPLHAGKTAAEVLALVSGYADQHAYDIVRNYWLAKWPAGDGEKTWTRCLREGVVPDTAHPAVTAEPDARRILSALKPAAAATGIEVAFYPSASTWDGRFANNGWLQEAPDPMTKLTWDNAALMSPATAKSLAAANGDVILIKTAAGEGRMPVWIQPGHADNAISIALGYGRTRSGRVGRNVGHNPYPLRARQNIGFGPAEVRKTSERYMLATTQEHHSMEGRALVREASLEEYRREPDFVEKSESKLPVLPLYPGFSYTEGNQWGMAIDLNACIGCNACVVACQAENNVPIVGKDQVSRGREMHWIRMDRYYTGPAEDPQAVTQPIACQQCENAPCESVCPVAATSHSPEGLNDMAYNRCVGTRYCANNCPYKVRRFNFLDYHKDTPEILKMVANPDVSVRMRGVMEKCTYCVQRIQETKIRAKADGRRPIRDGEIRTACQQTCPAEAIVFGNINDPNSRVSQLRNQERNYSLLGELNTKPRTTYLAKLRNPNPELA